MAQFYRLTDGPGQEGHPPFLSHFQIQTREEKPGMGPPRSRRLRKSSGEFSTVKKYRTLSCVHTA